jgi:hypothetical protein
MTSENGKTQIKILPADQVDELMKKYKKVEAAKKEKAQARKCKKCTFVLNWRFKTAELSVLTFRRQKVC